MRSKKLEKKKFGEEKKEIKEKQEQNEMTER